MPKIGDQVIRSTEVSGDKVKIFTHDLGTPANYRKLYREKKKEKGRFVEFAIIKEAEIEDNPGLGDHYKLKGPYLIVYQY